MCNEMGGGIPIKKTLALDTSTVLFGIPFNPSLAGLNANHNSRVSGISPPANNLLMLQSVPAWLTFRHAELLEHELDFAGRFRHLYCLNRKVWFSQGF